MCVLHPLPIDSLHPVTSIRISSMDIEELKCDLLHVLQNDDRDVLQKWTSLCRDFRSCIAAKIEERLTYENNCTEKKSANVRKVMELQREIDVVESKVNAIVLQRKTAEQDISNVTKLADNLTNELEEARKQKDSLSLDIMDLELEMETRKRNKILKWDAIKRACHIYKSNLDIHISLEEGEEGDSQRIKFSFFTHCAATKDKYFVHLLCHDNHWEVDQIEPNLKREHYNQLCIVTGEKYSKILDLTFFLCQVRNIFQKHYMKAVGNSDKVKKNC